VVKQQTRETAPQSVPLLTEIAESARVLVDSMRDIVWAIDPRRDDLSSVIYRVRQFASDVLEPRQIRLDFQTPPEFERVKLDPEQRRHLYLICKEAVNNVARHADCTEVALGVVVAGNRLTAIISDDGRGFATPDPRRRDSNGANGNAGHGLENMRRRAAELGGQLELDSAPGRGTRLKLTIPLKKR
jgi:two-component system sensor histidine kinase UhpB